MGPVRTCVGCRRKDQQDALVRIVATPEGVVVDPRHRLPGRGAYLHPSIECVERAVKRGAVHHALRRARPTESAVPSWAAEILQRDPLGGDSDKESSGDERTMSARA